MDIHTATILNETTQAFYAAQAESFSATRQSAWLGWKRVLTDTEWQGEQSQCRHAASKPRSILDIACGNVRFKDFLEAEMPYEAWDYHGVDNCVPLVGAPIGVAFTECDIVSELIKETSMGGPAVPSALPVLPASIVLADLTVCFGFFHHVPGTALRKRLLRALCAATKPGGIVAVSLWRFMDEPKLAKKACESHAAALQYFSERGVCLSLDEGDYLLGWQQTRSVFRYCHCFDSAQAHDLASSVSDIAVLADRFRADGRTDNLNEYLVFCVRGD